MHIYHCPQLIVIVFRARVSEERSLSAVLYGRPALLCITHSLHSLSLQVLSSLHPECEYVFQLARDEQRCLREITDLGNLSSSSGRNKQTLLMRCWRGLTHRMLISNEFQSRANGDFCYFSDFSPQKLCMRCYISAIKSQRSQYALEHFSFIRG